ncbi:hypothetical protein N9891_01500 [bacterium]|nr:hypothetical protein [bacterium]
MKPTFPLFSSALAAGSLSLVLTAVSFSAEVVGEKNPGGSLKKWHRVEVVLDGPEVEESSAKMNSSFYR